MVETEEEEIQRLVKEGIAKAKEEEELTEKQKWSWIWGYSRRYSKRYIIFGMCIILILSIIAMGILLSISGFYDDNQRQYKSGEIDDAVIAKANGLIGICDYEFTKSGGFDMNYTTSTENALRTCRDALNYVNTNIAGIGGMDATLMITSLDNKLPFLEAKTSAHGVISGSASKYSTYTSKNIAKLIYTKSGQEASKTFENVSDCKYGACDGWENFTEDDLKMRYKNSINNNNIDRISITTKRSGFIQFILFSSGTDVNGDYMRSDTISYTAKEKQ